MKLRQKTLLTLFAGLAAALPAFSNSLPSETFYFTGACSDCSGIGTGILTLTGNYVQGTSINPDFVSFQYNGTNLQGPFTILAGGGTDAIGIIPVSLPSTATISISNNLFYFDSSTDGFWQLGPNNEGDYGFTSSWSASTAPEPVAAELAGLGLVCLALFRAARLRFKPRA